MSIVTEPMKNIVRDTVAKIRDRGIVPEPRSAYLMRKYLVWAALGIVIVSGALSLSVAYFLLSSLDWDLYRFIRLDPFSYAFSVFPYFWAVLIGAFLVIAFADVRRTETGYRFSRSKIALSIVGSVAVLGAIMSFFGVGEMLSATIAKDFPYYGRHLVVTKETQWTQPDRGLLSGTIDARSGSTIGLSDLSGRRWNIVVDAETAVKPSVALSSGEMIKVIGIRTGEHDFRAVEIRPWIGKRSVDGNGTGQGYGETGRNGAEWHGRTDR